MFHYSIFEWLAFFYFYCFFGWCFESAFVSFQKKKLVNRGFMRGPFLPLYGSGAIMMLVVSAPFHDNLILTFLAGCVGATILEYVTGVTMESLFKVRYWDYSNQKFNFQGQVCLSSTLAWGGLTILMTRVVHRPVENLIQAVPETVLVTVVCILSVVLLIDFVLSFIAAIELRDILVKVEQLKNEFTEDVKTGVEHLQKRIDVVIAVVDAETQEYRDELSRRIAESYDKWAFREIGKKARFFQELNRFYRRKLLLDNPTMNSKRFTENLDTLKAELTEKLKERKIITGNLKKKFKSNIENNTEVNAEKKADQNTNE